MLINPTFLLNYLYCSSSTDGSTAILSFPSWCFFTICIYLYIYIYIYLTFLSFLKQAARQNKSNNSKTQKDKHMRH